MNEFYPTFLQQKGEPEAASSSLVGVPKVASLSGQVRESIAAETEGSRSMEYFPLSSLYVQMHMCNEICYLFYHELVEVKQTIS